MSADLLIANTLRIAREDLEGAKALGAIDNRNAVYLCEQAAEKLIRAVLTAENKHAGIGHQLDAMVDLLPDENLLKPALRELQTLTPYATSYRYPTNTGRIRNAPPSGELAVHIARVDAALERAVLHFGVDLDKKGSPARTTEPIR